jgi:hypothetical protein
LEEEYFNPKKKPRGALETYKAGLIVDKVQGIKRLKDPKRWCVLPASETVTVEVPLTKFKYNEYEKEVVQELGHVAWYKARFEVDKWVYDESYEDISVRQVLQKVDERLPSWRPLTRYWDIEYIGAIEVPGTVFCTERGLIKNLRYWKGEDKPEVVHKRDVAHTEGDKIGCSIFRRHQPPGWSSWTPSRNRT